MSTTAYRENEPGYWLQRLDSDEFQGYVEKLPISEVKRVFTATGKTDASAKEIRRIRMMLTLNRLCNRICNACLDKSNPLALVACSSCGLTWYCNERCRARDQEKHQLWCCNPNAAPDDGPMATALIKTKPSERKR